MNNYWYQKKLEILVSNPNEKDLTVRHTVLKSICNDKLKINEIKGIEITDEIWGDIIGLATNFLASKEETDWDNFIGYINGLM